MLTAVQSGFKFKEELDGDGFVKKKKKNRKTHAEEGDDYIFSVNKLESISCEIAPCLQPSVNDLPTSCFLLRMLNHYQLHHLFQWILKDISGVWSSNHFPALHLNNRGQAMRDCGSLRSW